MMHAPIRSRALLAAALTPALILSIGCKKPTLVGKWNGDAGAGPIVLELKADGTLVQTGSIPVVRGNIQAIGTYKVTDDRISLTITDVQTNGQSILNLVPAQFRSQLNQEATWKLDGDKLTLTAGGKSQTLTRA